jgi:hypothetical protein
MKRIGQSNQVNIKHNINYKKPTSRGEQTEKTEGETAMYVSAPLPRRSQENHPPCALPSRSA